MELTEKDRKYIKYQMRMGWVFAIIILSFGGLFNLVYFATPLFDFSPDKMLWINLTILSMAGSFWVSMNRKLIADLRTGKEVKLEKVTKKEDLSVNEAGSGNLYIPLLGDLFPSLWGQDARKVERFNFIINNTRYEVEKGLFNKVSEGDLVEMHIARASRELIEILPKARHTRERK